MNNFERDCEDYAKEQALSEFNEWVNDNLGELAREEALLKNDDLIEQGFIAKQIKEDWKMGRLDDDLSEEWKNQFADR